MKANLFVWIVVGVVSLAAGPANAANYLVSKTADTRDGACDADCSLREAVIAANANPEDDFIDVPAGTYLLSMTGPDEDFAMTGDLDLGASGGGELTIQGAGMGETVIDGGLGAFAKPDRIFHIVSSSNVAIRDLAIQNGDAGPLANGGGIATCTGGCGTVTLSGISIEDSHAGVVGGGLYADTDLILQRCGIRRNEAGIDGGGIYLVSHPTGLHEVSVDSNVAGGAGGGIFVDGGAVWLERSAVTRNQAAGPGGGVYNYGTATLENTTIAENGTSDDGGGVYNFGGSLTATNVTMARNTALGVGGGIANDALARLQNTIVADNAGAGNCAGSVAITSLGHNLDDTSDCGFAAAGDLNGLEPDFLTGLLANNGGFTETVALHPDSVLWGAGDDSVCTGNLATDQRGVARMGVCEIGAYEISCGNGTVEPEEQCDDGNAASGDGCSAFCEIEILETPEEESGGDTDQDAPGKVDDDGASTADGGTPPTPPADVPGSLSPGGCALVGPRF